MPVLTGHNRVMNECVHVPVLFGLAGVGLACRKRPEQKTPPAEVDGRRAGATLKNSIVDGSFHGCRSI